MKNIVNVPFGPGGTLVPAVELSFDAEKESFNVYICEADNIRVRVKLVVNKVYALVDKTGRILKDATGAPIIVTHSTNVQSAAWLGEKETKLRIPEDQ